MKLILLILLSLSIFAGNKTICGVKDDRIPSNDSKVGRVFMDTKFHGGCTATLVSKNCVITAGHCADILGYVEFNTPKSVNGDPVPSKPEDIYKVQMHTIESRNNGMGKDWAVAKLELNSNGKSAGELQGFYNIQFKRPKLPVQLRITGFGIDRKEPSKNLAQQTSGGPLRKPDRFKGTYVLSHSVDTMGGSSGASIINEKTGDIIGVHTHGGCVTTESTNAGTWITKSTFKKAILKCIQGDK